MGLELQIKKGDPKTLLLLWDGDLKREVSKLLFLRDLEKIAPDGDWEGFLAQFKLLEGKIGRRYALQLLAKRNYLSSELAEKLRSKGVSPEAAEAIILYCKEKGVIDDVQEVARFISKQQRKGLGRKAIYFKLRGKVDDALLREFLKSAAPSEEEALLRWLQKHAGKIDLSDRVAKNKLAAKLVRRGFSPELVINSLSEYKGQF